MACLLFHASPAQVSVEREDRPAAIRALYQAELAREPDAAGLRGHLAAMDGGATLERIREDLRNSPEGRRARERKKQDGKIRSRGRAAAAMQLGLVLLVARTVVRRLRVAPGSAERRAYLTEPSSAGAPAGLLLCLLLYSNYTQQPAQLGLCGVLAGLGLCLALGAPRWLAHAILFLALAGAMIAQVGVVAEGRLDRTSDRDEAVEAGARRLLAGENPWSNRTHLGGPVTTGPTSLLLALPWAGLGGKVNALSISAWLAFFLLLAACDIHYRNNTYVFLGLFSLLPASGFSHTFLHGLDELYWGAIALLPLHALLVRRHDRLAGGVAALIALCRLNYAFAIVPLLAWHFARKDFPRGRVAALAQGAFLAGVTVVGLILALAGTDALRCNFLTNSLGLGGMSSPHPVQLALHGALGDSRWPCPLLACALCALVVWRCRRQEQPFWSVTGCMLVIHTLLFRPPTFYDYILIVLIPALYACAAGGTSERSMDKVSAPLAK